MRSDRILGLALCSLVAACGSSGGTYPGDEQPVIDDASVDTTAPPPDGGNPVQDSGFPQDSTTPPPQLDATLDVNFSDGAIWTADSGGGGTDGGGPDGGGGCAPDGVLCNGNVAETCTNGQLSTTTCPGLCADGYGCVTCVPGSGTCSGNTGTLCKSDGSGYVTNNCDPQLGLSCNGGVCLGDCSPSNIGQSYIGCEYYAVTTSNSLLAQSTFPFSISVSNTSTSKAATVNITGPGFSLTNQSIPAGGISQYVLPWVSSLSTSNSSTLVVTNGAYHIKSTEPVAVYQFNPRDYVIGTTYSYSNDASLLLPVNAMTQNYRIATGATWYTQSGEVTVVATVDGTKVTYATPGGNTISAGGGLATNGGTSTTLNHGDVLHIAAAANGTTTSFGSDQSGALLTSTAPVEVFAGVDCTNMPAAVQYCDHIEEIVLPVETLRNDYLVVRPTNDYATPRQYVKIIGTMAGTTLTYDPPIAGAPASLGVGQSSFFEATVDFHVTSNNPIIVGQFMEGQNAFGSTCYNSLNNSLNCGDPAESVAVATAQFRSSYQFIAPPTYNENWVSIIAPNGKTVTVDGTNYTSGTAIGASSGYWTKAVKLCGANSCNGVHTASGTAPFGIQVYGYGAYTSYWYPGGLNLNR
ncbi:MAG TPA: IgGFc-binding protein [Polyangiaceae bacterium]|nr:IgGFc-binding protein [Polyangiaceae bacterium]